VVVRDLARLDKARLHVERWSPSPRRAMPQLRRFAGVVGWWAEMQASDMAKRGGGSPRWPLSSTTVALRRCNLTSMRAWER
jgi:hypothetical protein